MSVRQRPNKLEAYVWLALIYRDYEADSIKGRKVMDQMVAANPESALAYVRRCNYLREIKKDEEAEADIAKSFRTRSGRRGCSCHGGGDGNQRRQIGSRQGSAR